MKKCLIIFSIIFVVFFTAFIVSVAVTGADFASSIALSGTGIVSPFFSDSIPLTEVSPFFKGSTYHFESADEIRDVKIKLVNSNATVRVADVSAVSVDYTAGDSKTKFGASVKNGVLLVNEIVPFSSFSMIGLNANIDRSELTIVLPRKVYGNAELEMAAGAFNVAGLECSSLNVNTASGSGEYNVFADNIKAEIATGDIWLTNCTDKKAHLIDIEAASGSISFSGFTTDAFSVEAASGSVRLDGISGKGTLEAASGSIILSYAEWDGDLNIEAASGHVDIALPAGSGASVDLSALSGSVNCTLDGESETLKGNDHAVVGGANIHDIDVELLSGDVHIHN